MLITKVTLLTNVMQYLSNEVTVTNLILSKGWSYPQAEVSIQVIILACNFKKHKVYEVIDVQYIFSTGLYLYFYSNYWLH